MVSAPTRSVGAAMVSGPGYLVSAWPWRALLWTLFGGVLGAVLFVASPVLILAGLSRPLRTAVWAPLLEIECARLALIDEAAADRARRDLAAARAEHRLPSLRQVGYLLLTALGTGPWGVVCVGFSAILTAVLVAAPSLVGPGEPINVGLWLVDSPAEAWAAVPLGTAILILTAYLNGGYAAAVGQITSAALTDPQALQREVARLEQSRTALLDAVEQERRRIESDLHDRVQHRLVALALTLGIAENTHGDDDTGRLAADAHRQVDDIAAELRSVLLGILPRALTEHGLAAAAADLIAQYPLAVQADFGDTERPGRLPAPVEHAAYLVLNETLTNVVKHAGATSVTIAAQRRKALWEMVIRDDGHGGARIEPGRGLATLAARLEALNGTLTIVSPTGGPTELTMRTPL
ncbi:sensor histidine kinase [Mycolicibacterium parafortuitum]|uniref:histidine kinase n=1 Tax=Mycolicibacterium parafortuitum TaxID=39692 RepID=A0A375YDC4_MYCPF|nr:histidine kinase [Mycolicibacterium parafortuitum]ORB31272.1 sensor histidine kinase [Mycolicibacterium parafortuitum]SRX79094.1 histidine kinase [Kribbella flavida DSM] [Mycolicibacterium parafortuitum]